MSARDTLILAAAVLLCALACAVGVVIATGVWM